MNNQQKRHKILLIVGPTASGKSALAVRLAKKFNGEIISADSRQVYKELTVGTGKILKKEMSGIRHHLLNVCSVKDSAFTAHDFYTQAQGAIATITKRGKLPIIVGGTGFYTDVLTRRITMGDVAPDQKLRLRLEKKSPAQLYALLEKRDHKRFSDLVAKNELNNIRRVIRAIEISYMQKSEQSKIEEPYATLWIGIQPPKEVLKKKIEIRNAQMLKDGLLRECKRLRALRILDTRIKEFGFEYFYINEHLKGTLTQLKALEWMNIKTWQYAKRQITYWKRNTDILWFAVPHDKKINAQVRSFLRT